MSNHFDEFYPISTAMRDCAGGVWQLAMVVKLRDHLVGAKAGDREKESRLINRLGQLRRNVAAADMNVELTSIVQSAVAWLRTQGRTVDMGNHDPRRWISRRGGAPRW